MPEHSFIIKEADTRCKRCSLSTNQSIFGHSFVPLSQVKLIIVSAYPASEEIKQGITLAPNKKADRLDHPNAGRFLRNSINYVFDKDENLPVGLKNFYQRIFYTNIIKCSPIVRKEQQKITKTHINTCRDWLELEISTIAKYNPTVPILIASSEALSLLKIEGGISQNRRKVFYYKDLHPTIVTFNPIEPSRYAPRIVTKQRVRGDGSITIEDTAYMRPAIIGSPCWHFLQDLQLIKSLVIDNHNKYLTKS